VTIQRFFPVRLAAALMLVLTLLAGVPAHADPIDVQRASLQSDGSGWSLDAQFDFDLNSSLSDAVNKGVALYFTTSFELSRSRWYWFDDVPVSVTQTMRLSYVPLTGEYRVTTGGLHQSFTDLKDALAVVRHITSWHVIDKNQVTPGDTYTASVRMALDTALMAKPFQVDAVNNRDWMLGSDWKRFVFTVSDRAK
jgi:hypothetical protein